MKQNITVTIATVVYNGAATLAEAMQSVVSQSYHGIEYLIIDGASTDDTLRIAQGYASRFDFINIHSEPDHGIYDAINKAQQLATGDFLIFLGCDDVLYNSKVIEEFAVRADNKDKVYYGDVITKGANEIRNGVFSTEKLLMQNICHQSVFYPKIIYKHFTYNLKYKFFADWDYNLRAWSQYGAFTRLELIVALFKETGASSAQDAVFFKDRIQLAKQYFGDKYTWLLTMQELKKRLLGKTDLRKIKGYLFPKLK